MAIGMILKKIKAHNRNIRKTFYYILNLNNEGDIGDKVEYAGTENFLYDDIEKQIKEMESRHKEYKENNGKVTPDMHLILSYPTTFVMSKEEYKKDVKAVLKHLGMELNSCLWAVHSNTKNTHLHLYIDRIHPVTNTFDTSKGTCFETLKSGTVRRHESNCFQAACFEISKKYNYSTSQYRVDTKGIPQRSVKSNQVRVNPKDKVGYEFALKAQNIIDEYLIVEDKSWNELLEIFKNNEISYDTIYAKKTRNVRGAVFTDLKTGYKLKSSALPIGHKELEKFLGVFPFEAKTLPKKEMPSKEYNDRMMDLIKEEIKHAFMFSRNWEELEAALKRRACLLMQKASSFTILYGSTDSEFKTIAPSKIDRSYSIANLKRAWGEPPKGLFIPYMKKPKTNGNPRAKKTIKDKKSSRSKTSFYVYLSKSQSETILDKELLQKLRLSFKNYKITKVAKTVIIEFNEGYTLKVHEYKIELISYKNEEELIAAIHSMIQLGTIKGWKLENMAFNGSEAFKTKAYEILDERIREQNKHLLSENSSKERTLETILEQIISPDIPVELPETDTKYDDDDDDDIDIDF